MKYENEKDENAVMDYDNYILASVAPFAGCVSVMHEYDGSATTIRHYFTTLARRDDYHIFLLVRLHSAHNV